MHTDACPHLKSASVAQTALEWECNQPVRVRITTVAQDFSSHREVLTMIDVTVIDFTMTGRVKSSVLVFLLALGAAASAQTKTGSVRFNPHPAMSNAFALRQMPARPMPARPIIVRLPATAHRIAISSNSGTTSTAGSNFETVTPGLTFGNTTSFDLGQLLNNTPGLGFDFPHLAALNRNLGVQALIDPVTQQDLALGERLLQISGSANTVFPFFGGGYSEPVVMEQQQPPVIVLQQPASAAAEASPNESAPTALPAEEQPPLPDVGQFSLVLHSGKQIKAVAFTRQGGLIVYVTNDGIRGSFAVSDLDVPATQQLNQQHGTPLQLPL